MHYSVVQLACPVNLTSNAAFGGEVLGELVTVFVEVLCALFGACGQVDEADGAAGAGSGLKWSTPILHPKFR